MDYTTAYPAYAEACRTSGVDSEEAENLRGDAVFSLVPSAGASPALKGRTATKSGSEFNSLINAIPENARLDGTDVYHGFLLGGVPAEGGNEGGGSTGGEGTVTPPTTNHTITFLPGTAEGSFDASNVTVPAQQSVAGGSQFVAGGFSATYNNVDPANTYVFAGWYNGSEKVTSFVVTTDVTLTASWTRTQSFAISFFADSDITYGSVAGWSQNGDRLSSQTDIQNLVKNTTAADMSPARTFLGWQINGTGEIYNESNAGSIVVTGDTTFKAAYKEPLSVKIDPNNGINSVYNFSANSSTEFYNGQEIHLPAAPTAPSGKQFAYWKSSITTDTTNYAANALYTVRENVTFTAQWATLYTVTYELNGGTAGSGFTTSYPLVAGTEHTVQSASAVEKAGHTFAGWNDGSTTHQPGDKIIVSGNVTLTAQWTVIQYTVTYDANGGTVNGGATYEMTVNAGSSLNTSAVVPTRNGFNFKGWLNNGTAETNIVVNSDITLTAQWEEITTSRYTLTFDVNGGTFNPNGSGATAVMQLDEGTDIAPYVNASYATKPGYAFVAWEYVDTDGSSHEFNSAMTLTTFPIEANVTFTAKFVDETYAIDSQADLNKIDDSAANMAHDWYVVADFSLTSNHVPLQRSDCKFSGTLYGNGYTISNITINQSDNGGGLIRNNQGTIRDLYLNVKSIFAGIQVGAACGINSGSVINVHVTISERIKSNSNTNSWANLGIPRASAVGGVVGSSNGGYIANCSVVGNIDGYIYYNGTDSTANRGGGVGGIVGVTLGNDTIEQCWFKGNLNKGNANGRCGEAIGGIVGHQVSGTISNCWAITDYMNGYDWLGGIAGRSNGTIKSCFAYTADGAVFNTDWCSAAAIVSTDSPNNPTVTNCYYENGVFEGYGTYGSAVTVGGTTPFNGFDTTIWEFKSGYYPGLINNPSRA